MKLALKMKKNNHHQYNHKSKNIMLLKTKMLLRIKILFNKILIMHNNLFQKITKFHRILNKNKYRKFL